MQTQLLNKLLAKPGLELALVFGSFANGTENEHSDIDIAVRYKEVLTSESKFKLMSELAAVTGRPIDLIDLRTAGTILSHQALTTGKKLWGDEELFRKTLVRSTIDYADFAPLLQRAYKERQERWTH